MSELSLIPFGLRESDQTIVDVSEVERGVKCNCICPSCKATLVAKQGDINEWHFAHISKGASNTAENECEYSFWVSVLSMAKQIISTAQFISFPSLILYNSNGRKIKIRNKQNFAPDSIEIEKVINSVSADAVLKLGEYQVAIIFNTQHKKLDNYSTNLDSNQIGVLEISLLKAKEWLFGSRNQGKYSQVLKQNILSNNIYKKWLYHPRKKIIEKKENINLYYKPPSFMEIRNDNYARREVEKKHYTCMECNIPWFGTHKCVTCGSTLYSIVQKIT